MRHAFANALFFVGMFGVPSLARPANGAFNVRG